MSMNAALISSVVEVFFQMKMTQAWIDEQAAGVDRLIVSELFRLIGVEPKTERDEDEDGRPKQKAAFAFEAGFAEQTFEGAIGHGKIANPEQRSADATLVSDISGRNGSSVPPGEFARWRVAALSTRLAGASIGTKLFLIPAHQARCRLRSCLNARTAHCNTAAQHGCDGPAQFLGLAAG